MRGEGEGGERGREGRGGGRGEWMLFGNVHHLRISQMEVCVCTLSTPWRTSAHDAMGCPSWWTQ